MSPKECTVYDLRPSLLVPVLLSPDLKLRTELETMMDLERTKRIPCCIRLATVAENLRREELQSKEFGEVRRVCEIVVNQCMRANLPGWIMQLTSRRFDNRRMAKDTIVAVKNMLDRPVQLASDSYFEEPPRHAARSPMRGQQTPMPASHHSKRGQENSSLAKSIYSSIVSMFSSKPRDAPYNRRPVQAQNQMAFSRICLTRW